MADKVAKLPDRTSYDWSGGQSILATLVFHAFFVVRLLSPLQWLKYLYRWHGWRPRSPFRIPLKESRLGRAERPDIPPAFTELYFLFLLLLTWPLVAAARALVGDVGPLVEAVLVAIGWLLVVECLQWALYYLVFRLFIEPSFTLFHPAENLLVFPLVIVVQCAVIASLAGDSPTSALATMFGDNRLDGAWNSFAANLGRLYLAVAVVALLQSLPAIQARRSRGAIAIVGAGEVARSYVIPVLIRLGYRVRSIYVFDTDSSRRRLIVDDGVKLPVRSMSAERIVDEIAQLDLPAIIATPTDSHLHYIAAFASRGIDFAVEKPICTGLERKQLEASETLMRTGFAMGYYVLEKALPLTYFCSLQPAYREFLASRDGSALPDTGRMQWFHDHLGKLNRVEVMLLEGRNRSQQGRVRLWTEQPPVLAQLIETAIHPLQLVCQLVAPAASFGVNIAQVRLGRNAKRAREVEAMTDTGIAPTFLDATLTLDGVPATIRVGKHMPDQLCGRRLYAEWEHGSAIADFDKQSLMVTMGNERLEFGVGGRAVPDPIPYEIQLRLFERAREGSYRDYRFDALGSQLQALRLWQLLCEGHNGVKPVVYTDEDPWPEPLRFSGASFDVDDHS